MNGSADETKQNSPPPTTNGSGGKRGPKKKIPGLIEKYNLDAIGSKMASLWTHPDKSERATLNDLRHMLNRAMLESAAKSAGADPVAGELEHGYEQLTSDDANHADREDFVDRMEMKGVDIDEVESDFIKSSATIHSYLQDVEGAEYPTESTKNRANKALNHVQRLENPCRDSFRDMDRFVGRVR